MHVIFFAEESERYIRVGSGSRNLLMKLCVSWDLEIPDQPNLAENSRALAPATLLAFCYSTFMRYM